MLTVEKGNNSNVIIRGDFWDFDRLYFAISKFTGDYGIDSTCPFSGYEAICESLLGLCYEIRKAQEGKRGLYEQYNGIPEHWFEKESVTDDTNDLQDYDDEIDELNTKNNDSLPEDDDWDAYFPRKAFPNATTTNTLLQTELSFSEALYYAFIFRELLEKKELFLLQRKALKHDDSNGMRELNIEYYYCQAQTDLARITIYMESTFRTLYHLIGKEAFIQYIDLFSAKPNGFLHGNLQACNALVVKYGKEQAADPAKNVTEYLDKLYEELCQNQLFTI